MNTAGCCTTADERRSVSTGKKVTETGMSNQPHTCCSKAASWSSSLARACTASVDVLPVPLTSMHGAREPRKKWAQAEAVKELAALVAEPDDDDALAD
jgi:hypothetical protein